MIDLAAYPPALRPLLEGATLSDSSGQSGARTLFIDRDGGYFLKSAAAGALAREAEMTRFFHGKGLAPAVLAYLPLERDWLLTEKLHGEVSCAARYTEQPERLCDTLAQLLVQLHGMDTAGCPVIHTAQYLARARHNCLTGAYDSSHFPDSFGYASAEEALRVIDTRGQLLCSDTLLHGDYCLPNVILRDWAFSGFIDLGSAGVGDRHVDLFWALWSLWYNLKTDQYRERFMDAYGRADVDEERLRVVAAVEVFG